MTRFSYRAVTPTGAIERGRLDAETREALLDRLRAEGKTPLSVRRAGALGGLSPGAGRLPESAWLDLVRPLALLLRSGTPLAESLRMTASLSRRAGVRAAALRLRARIEEGRSLAAALEAEPGVPPHLPALARAGEHAGTLAEVLSRLAGRMKSALAMRRQIGSAMAYPIVLVFVAIGALTVLLGVVVPRFETVFAAQGEALPAATRFVMAASRFVVSDGWTIAVALLLAWLGLRLYAGRPAGRRRLAEALLRMPMLGDLVIASAFTGFARTLGGLIEAGVPLGQAFTIARAVVGNEVLRSEFDAASARAQGGEGLARALEAETRFPLVPLRVILVSEESGALAGGLIEAAEMASEELDRTVKTAVSLVEPALILLLGLIVGGIVVSLFSGILAMNALAFD
ncbi:MAG: type II secretion system F family protein [Alphaproteobacteria bacterium]|nr:type II secretion system F family protein [Alphaproteobacteria bacterium]